LNPIYLFDICMPCTVFGIPFAAFNWIFPSRLPGELGIYPKRNRFVGTVSGPLPLKRGNMGSLVCWVVDRDPPKQLSWNTVKIIHKDS